MKRMLMAMALAALTGVTAQARSISIATRNTGHDGVIQSVELMFGAAGENETNRLFAVWGRTVGGVRPTDWDNRAEIALVPPETASYSYTMPAGWETSVQAIRFYLVPTDLPYDNVVTHLDSTGQEYVNTDCTHTPDTRVEAILTLLTPAAGDYSVPFGARGTLSTNYAGGLYVFTRYGQEDKPGFARGDTVAKEFFGETSTLTIGKTYTFAVEGQRLSWSLWGVENTPVHTLDYTYAQNTRGGVTPMYVFTLNEGGAANTACNTKMRLFTFTMTDGDTVLCDLLPVVKDGVGYFYDRVSRTLKGNSSGQGAFVVSTAPISFDEQSATATEVLEVGSAPRISVTGTNFVDGVAVSLELALDPGTQARPNVLYAGYGPTAGGDGPDGWAHFDRVGMISPETTTLTYPLPADWGTDVKALRFFLAAQPAADYDSAVEYLESTGQEWINTGVRHTTTAVVNCTADILSNPVGDYNVPFGSRKKDNTLGVYFFTRYNKEKRVGYTFGGGEVWGDAIDLPLDVPTTIRADGLCGSLYTNGVRFGTITAGGDGNWNNGVGPVLVFTMNETSTPDAVEPNTACNTKMRLRAFTMFNEIGKTVTCDLAPVVKDGTGYLYDRVSGRLLGNGSRTGAFIVGPACYGGEPIRAASSLLTIPMPASERPQARYCAPVSFRGIGGTKVVAGVPVEVAISPDRIVGFAYDQCAVDGSDIRFYSAEGELLPHEIDTWTPTGTSLVWVRVPALDPAGGMGVTMCWGATRQTPPARPATEVWRDYVAVWHFNEASGTARDSGPYGFHAEPRGDAVNSAGVDGVTVSRVRQINGGWFEAPTCSGLFLGSAFTASGWFRMTSPAATASPLLFSTKTTWKDSHGWYLAVQEAPNRISVNGGTTDTKVHYSFPNLTEKWRYVASVFDGTSANLYGNPDVNTATSVATFTLCAPQESADTLKLFHNVYGSYAGYAEELRIRRGHVDDAWMKAEYMGMLDTFASVRPMETLIGQGTMIIVR